ncbi:MAG: hypothetical protein GXO90_08570 [FCB group bacterium]|nr:hypothetical protein [FCB group bacterium]
MRSRIRSAILSTLFIASLGAVNSGPISVYLYLIEFENISSDPTLDWMKAGLVDILSEGLNRNPAVAIKSRADLEKVMNNRNLLLHQPRGLKNVLLLGKFSDKGGDVEIQMQLVNIANWEQVDQRVITGNIAEITSLSARLSDAVNTMLKPLLPVSSIPKTAEAKSSPGEISLPPMVTPLAESRSRPNPSLQQSKSVASSLHKDLEGMEVAMDLALGRRDKAPEKPVGAQGEWELDLNMANEERDNPENEANTAMLIQVLDNLVNHPYEVTLNPPKIIYDRDQEDSVQVEFKVIYKLRENLIRDMLTSLPYNALKQEGSLTIFTFTKDRFNFPADLRERISQGEYLASPVIQFFDSRDNPRVVIADAIGSSYVHPAGTSINYIPTHHFSPLIDFTIGGWSLQVAMEAVDIPVIYRFGLPLDATGDLVRVKLKFVSSDDFATYIANLR